MIILPVMELNMLGVADPNAPNLERILIRPTVKTDLSTFGILITVQLQDGTLVPVNDNFFWFGAHTVEPPSWIVVFTGGGTTTLNQKLGAEIVHTFYWDRGKTVFATKQIKPLLISLGGMSSGNHLAEPAPAQDPKLEQALAELRATLNKTGAKL